MTPALARIPDGQSGVYLIRDASTGRLLYVGESHTGRLRKTLLRHFQKWSGKTRGVTYPPDTVQVRWRILPPRDAVKSQNAFIRRLKPRDNEVGQVVQQKTLLGFMGRMSAWLNSDVPF